MLYPRKGVSDLARMSPAAGQGEVLRHPRAMSDLTTLVGEGSSNLPGVPGVGPSTAVKWLPAVRQPERP